MPTPTYIPLATVTLASATDTVTFSSIPATYRDLIMVVAGTSAVSASAHFVQFNGDAGNQSAVLVQATSSYTDSQIYILTDDTQFVSIVQIMDYSATDKHKTTLMRSNYATENVWMGAGRWASTAAINEVKLTRSGRNLNIGTQVSLYGIAG